MRLSLRWLEEFVDLPTRDPDEVADALLSLGHEVESYEVHDRVFAGVSIARAATVAPHPNADRLRVVEVDDGRRTHEVVCGAWNFEEGAIVAYAPPGATLAGNVTLDAREIRGVVSHGMICSEVELGIGDDAAGILVFEERAEVGQDLATLVPLPDVVFDVSITSNRPDAMSVLGLARDLAAKWGLEVRRPKVVVDEAGDPTAVRVQLDDPVGCPRFTAREVRGVRIGPAPLWMRVRLRACGVRPINNVVDVSNYVMLELGHPLHAFDLDRIADETIIVRRPHPDETLETLDGVVRALSGEDLVIADGRVAVGLAGVMGGGDSEVSDDTTRILIECAYFDPGRILLMSYRHKLRTEASARFERGMDPNHPMDVSARAVQLIIETAGGAAAPDPQDAYPDPIAPWTVELPAGEIPRLLGIDLLDDLAGELLTRLEFRVEGTDPMLVTVPTFRPDVTRAADLVEEVARLHGYEHIPERVPAGIGGGLPESEILVRTTGELMTAAGFHEAQTLSFLGQDDLDALGLPESDRRRRGIRIVNPLRDEESVLRTTLLSGLLQAAAYNRAHRIADVALFEIGRVFFPSSGELPDQPTQLAFVATGGVGGGWLEKRRELDVFDATGVWELLAGGLGLPGARLEQASEPPFHPGRCAVAWTDHGRLGVVGELHPSVARAFGLEHRVIAGELNLASVSLPDHWKLNPPSVFPPVVFDLAFVLGPSVTAAQLVSQVRLAAGPQLESLTLFDVFRGPPLEADRRSLAVRLTLRAPERTLTDEEMADIRTQVIESVERNLDAGLRSG